jgi:hypothetical protein
VKTRILDRDWEAGSAAIGTSVDKPRCGLFEEEQMTRTKAFDLQSARTKTQPASPTTLNPDDEARKRHEGAVTLS